MEVADSVLPQRRQVTKAHEDGSGGPLCPRLRGELFNTKLHLYRRGEGDASLARLNRVRVDPKPDREWTWESLLTILIA